MSSSLTRELADQFSRLTLGHVTREYPCSPGHVWSGPDDSGTPRQLHPVFFGSFDWHSCVHGYWLLARLLCEFPDLDAGPRIRELFDASLTAPKVARECEYFGDPLRQNFERPYGWAWLLKLSAALGAHHDSGWAQALAPLARLIRERFEEFLAKATYPNRAGTHHNTAFAVRLALDYADAVGDAAFRTQLAAAAKRWYGDDADCPAWGEPSLDDFLSPCLMEAECMRRTLDAGEFAAWFERFLPRLAASQPSCLFTPAVVSDHADGRITHLNGLNLSRAWCFRSLASALPPDDARARLMREAASRHGAAALPHVSGNYMAEHWLATYAVLMLTVDGGAGARQENSRH
ncbi:DUF2891 domain-containing protein [Burkholderia plantarii]|uniref:DUF2891 domain-containing protein n=1 Tax=Burkholderia plantarii TaxID=41899 RepID=UPI0006D89559|nr:DUF2891 domain-containing protein [Burkholderia plantarii]ALK35275.1 hypothetical protein bpln_1p1410 [Burkholderia plantarii]